MHKKTFHDYCYYSYFCRHFIALFSWWKSYGLDWLCVHGTNHFFPGALDWEKDIGWWIYQLAAYVKVSHVLPGCSLPNPSCLYSNFRGTRSLLSSSFWVGLQTMEEQPSKSRVELHEQPSDGITVSLLWSTSSGPNWKGNVFW